ncbi:MAG: hypothetical protein E7667_06700, partial [Ruminococcaceae bacterium]|nr:hypothetical protein [Oscillospiraceae bacterium]
MRKFLALMALLLCFVVLFVACGDDEKATEAPTTPTACDHTYSNDCDADCNKCGEERDVAHAAEEVITAVKATCTETGLTEGKKCSVCGAVTVAQEVVPAKGHTEAVTSGKAPTCTEAGLTEGKHCSVCNEVLVERKVILATGHSIVVIEGKDATCTETGLTDGSKCSVCEVEFKAQEEIPALGHKWTEATCTAPKTCSVCGTTEGEAAGHTAVVIPAVDATCTTAGLTEGSKCSVCGEILEPQQEVVPALGHTPGEAATCTTAQTCTVCNAELAPALG